MSSSRRAAHPRAGGENSTVERLSLSYSGSSPRGRGKRARIVGRSAGVRLIPARAGKTTTSTPSRPTLRAHPRAGGENKSDTGDGSENWDSSPRGRGKHRQSPRASDRRRLIPARAGKTTSTSSPERSSPAHPRAGGENIVDKPNVLANLGSSPRGRGKPRFVSQTIGGTRLIPARAGKTALSPPMGWNSTAHPRAGGENDWLRVWFAGTPGSSPRGRGKQHS